MKKRIIVYLVILLSICLFARITEGEEVNSCPRWGYVLEELGKCESGNRDDIKIVDSNGLFSYGRFQFQEQTWKKYLLKYNLLPYSEEEELMNWIHDEEIQKQLTTKILEEGGWRNWWNCFHKDSLKDFQV